MPRKNNASTIESPSTAIQSRINAIHSGDFPLKAWQVRILKFLASARGPCTRDQISIGAPAHRSNQTNAWGIGLVDPEKRLELESDTLIPSLLTLGYAKEVIVPAKDEKGRPTRCYQITPEGRKALKRILKEEAE